MRTTGWIALAALGAAGAAGSVRGDEPTGPEIGKPAPAARLNDHTGVARRVGPGGPKEWTVLAFYPKAMTPG
jgi:hypothetical protein